MSVLGSWFLNRRSKEGCHEICIFFPSDPFHKALFYYASSSLIINKTKSHQGFYVHGNLQSKSFSSYSAHLNKGKKCKKKNVSVNWVRTSFRRSVLHYKHIHWHRKKNRLFLGASRISTKMSFRRLTAFECVSAHFMQLQDLKHTGYWTQLNWKCLSNSTLIKSILKLAWR